MTDLILQRDVFSPLAQFYAKELCQAEASRDPELFIQYLFSSCQKGHIAVQITESGCYPRVEEVIDRDIFDRFIDGDEFLLELNKAIISSFKSISPSLLTFFDILEKSKLLTPLVRIGDTVYFSKFFAQETRVLQNFNSLIIQKGSRAIDFQVFTERAYKFCDEGKLTGEQLQLITYALEGPLSFFVGGPGTGKTYSAGLFLKLFLDSLVDKETPFNVAIAAPTGRASQQLASSIYSFMDKAPSCVNLSEPQTLHSLLKLSSPDLDLLPADLIILDECSMMDLKMFDVLFESVKPGTRIIFLGDANQLPAVESGSLFADLFTLFQRLRPNSSKLTTCMRAESLDIVKCANAANLGLFNEVVDWCRNSDYLDLKHIEGESKGVVYQNIVEGFSDGDVWRCLRSSPEKAFQAMQKIRLLSPFRSGPFGVEAINAYLKNQALTNFRAKFLPVVVTENSHSMGLYNGDLGLLSTDGLFCYFYQEGYSALRVIPVSLVPSIEISFALSIHKSQGSEFGHVLVVLPAQSALFGRELIYTAITRAKQRLTLFADLTALEKSLSLRSYRYSGLLERSQV